MCAHLSIPYIISQYTTTSVTGTSCSRAQKWWWKLLSGSKNCSLHLFQQDRRWRKQSYEQKAERAACWVLAVLTESTEFCKMNVFFRVVDVSVIHIPPVNSLLIRWPWHFTAVILPPRLTMGIIIAFVGLRHRCLCDRDYGDRDS